MASDISSVIALAKPANGRNETEADERQNPNVIIDVAPEQEVLTVLRPAGGNLVGLVSQEHFFWSVCVHFFRRTSPYGLCVAIQTSKCRRQAPIWEQARRQDRWSRAS